MIIIITNIISMTGSFREPSIQKSEHEKKLSDKLRLHICFQLFVNKKGLIFLMLLHVRAARNSALPTAGTFLPV